MPQTGRRKSTARNVTSKKCYNSYMNIFKHGIHLQRKSKSRILQRMRFCMTGGIGVSAGYLVLYTLTEYAHAWYILSSIIASAINCGIDFYLQKHWAFHNTDKRHLRRQLRLYVTMYAALAFINITALYVFVDHFHVYYIFAQIILTFVLSIVSYAATRMIFNQN